MTVMKIGIVDTCRCDIVFDILRKGPGRPATKSGIYKTPETKKH